MVCSPYEEPMVHNKYTYQAFHCCEHENKSPSFCILASSAEGDSRCNYCERMKFSFYLLIIQHVFCLSIMCGSDCTCDTKAVSGMVTYYGEHITLMRGGKGKAAEAIFKLLNNSLLPFHCG